MADYGRTHTLDDNAPIFLHNGYIIVNFDIESIPNEDVDHPHLQYINGPLDNQWKMEGFNQTSLFQYGDVIFYDADHSSRDDFGVGGTH